jgi:hypothetical protein
MIKHTTELLSKALVAKKDEAHMVEEQDRKVNDEEPLAPL